MPNEFASRILKERLAAVESEKRGFESRLAATNDLFIHLTNYIGTCESELAELRAGLKLLEEA
jgi:hypothetical protein